MTAAMHSQQFGKTGKRSPTHKSMTNLLPGWCQTKHYSPGCGIWGISLVYAKMSLNGWRFSFAFFTSRLVLGR